MISSFLIVAVAATPPAAGWRFDQAHLDVAVVCTQGRIADAASKAAIKSFAEPRALRLAEAPRAKLPQLDPSGLGPTLDRLEAKEKAAVTSAATATVLAFSWPRADAGALARAYTIAGTLAEGCSGVLIDLVALSAWSRARWNGRIPGAEKTPVMASDHFSIHMVPLDDGALMFDTGGLERFALADLVIPRVSRGDVRNAGLMMNLLVQRLVEGAGPNARGQIVIRLADLQDPEFRKRQLESAFTNARRELTIDLKRSPGTGDLRAGTWLVGFPTLGCTQSDTCLEQASDALFGSEDKAKMVPHDAALLAARDRARVLLAPYKAKLAKGFPGREFLLVKGPFTYPEGTEWCWVEVQQWKDGVLRGPLRTQPEFVKGLVPGQAVQIKEGEVFDFMYQLEDGSFFGNETGKILQPSLFVDLGGGRSKIRER